MELNEIRKRIDAIDDQIINLLSERIRLAIQTAGLKSNVEDPAREKEVLERLLSLCGDAIDPDFIKLIYLEIFKESKKQQLLKIN